MKIIVTGASGFVGGHVVKRLVADGHSVTGLSRSAVSESRRHAGAVYRSGVDVAESSTIDPTIFDGVDAVVHLVGIILERKPRQTFQRIHVEGTRNVLAASRDGKIKKFVYLSAIGSKPDAAAEYSRTKFAAEERVKGSALPYVILRPSIILGSDGEFVAQMRDLVRRGGLPINIPFPFIPVPGSGNNRFQPIYVDDLTECISRSVTDEGLSCDTIEIGGATRVSFNELLKAFAREENIHKPMLHAPIPILSLVAPLVQMLPNPPFNADQLKNLKTDNITNIEKMIATFQIQPLSFDQSMARIYAK